MSVFMPEKSFNSKNSQKNGTRKKYQTKYSKKYETDYPWSCPSSKGDLYAHCMLCLIDISISHAGGKALRDHEETKKHRNFALNLGKFNKSSMPLLNETQSSMALERDVQDSGAASVLVTSASLSLSGEIHPVSGDSAISLSPGEFMSDSNFCANVESLKNFQQSECCAVHSGICSASSQTSLPIVSTTLKNREGLPTVASDGLNQTSVVLKEFSRAKSLLKCSTVGIADESKSLLKSATTTVDALTTDDLTCNICGVEFTQWTKLKRHLMAHVWVATASKKSAVSNKRHDCRSKRPQHAKAVHQENSALKDPALCDSSNNEKDEHSSGISIDEEESPTPTSKTPAEPENSLNVVKEKPKKPVHNLCNLNLPCRICRTVFHDRQELARHQKVTHNNRRPFQCVKCEKFFTTQNNLHIHEKHKHAPGPNPCKCPYCSKVLSSKPNLRIHIRIHKGERPFKCPMCEKSFTRKANMEMHVFCHTQERRFTCEVCGQSFITVCTLHRHMKLHSGERKYACDICGATYITSNDLRRHALRHEKVKPFSCQLCGKQFTRPYDLKIHIRYHKKDVQYTCDICLKQFVQAGNYRRHLRRHTGERPYSCTLCSLTFSQVHHLRGHVKTHHGDGGESNGPPVDTIPVSEPTSGLPVTREIKASQMAPVSSEAIMAVQSMTTRVPVVPHSTHPHTISYTAHQATQGAHFQTATPPIAHTSLAASGIIPHGCQVVSSMSQATVTHGGILPNSQVNHMSRQYKGAPVYTSNDVTQYPVVFNVCPQSNLPNAYQTH